MAKGVRLVAVKLIKEIGSVASAVLKLMNFLLNRIRLEWELFCAVIVIVKEGSRSAEAEEDFDAK